MTIPAGLIGLLVMAAYSNFRGKDLDKDPQFQALIADPEAKRYVYGRLYDSPRQEAPVQTVDRNVDLPCCSARRCSAWCLLRTSSDGRAKKPLSMTLVNSMFMLCAGALICMITKTPPKSVGGTSVFRSGMVAVVCVFGVAWLSDTIFKAHLNELKEVLVEYVKLYPWAYAVVLLLVSKLVNSQAAAIAIVVPVAISIGTPTGVVVGCCSACYGYYIIPTYPSDRLPSSSTAPVTTHIGKFVTTTPSSFRA